MLFDFEDTKKTKKQEREMASNRYFLSRTQESEQQLLASIYNSIPTSFFQFNLFEMLSGYERRGDCVFRLRMTSFSMLIAYPIYSSVSFSCFPLQYVLLYCYCYIYTYPSILFPLLFSRYDSFVLLACILMYIM